MLDEELPALLASISTRRSASAALEGDGREVSQSGQTEVESQGFVVRPIIPSLCIKVGIDK